tara:strand:- start:344 stop:514 length:171 start_codon:yes stop_codon:yes gene_type:complete
MSEQHKNKQIIESMILGYFDENNVWQGPRLRKLMIDNEVIDIDDYAAEFGLTLPDS